MEATTISRASRTTTMAFATAALLGGSLMSVNQRLGDLHTIVGACQPREVAPTHSKP
jgi:hypothetical protein